LTVSSCSGSTVLREHAADDPVRCEDRQYGETKFHLVINLTTAKALGLRIPESLLLLADEVIE